MIEQITLKNGRFYLDRATKVPYFSITTVLGVIDKGKGFEFWLKKEGAKCDDIAKVAADSGTKIHDICEHMQLYYIEHGCYQDIEDVIFEHKEFLNEVEIAKLIGFDNFCQECKPHFIAAEYQIRLEHPYQVAGKVDIFCEVDGQQYVVDIKTGKSLHDTMNLQTAAYLAGTLIHECIDTKNPGRAILHLKDTTKKGYNFKVIETDYYSDLEAYFAACLLYFRLKKSFIAEAHQWIEEN